MKKEIQELKIENGKSIFVEMEIIDQDIVLNINKTTQIQDMPPGAEPTGVFDDALIGAKLFKENIANVAESVYESLKDMQPDEWTVEMNIGFKGKVTPIPFIASSELDGGIKVKATWKKV